MIIVIPQAAKMSAADLDQLGPVKKPLGAQVSRLIGRKYIDEADGIDCMGVWECSPGRWQRTIMQEEFAHFISGSATFVPESGAPIEIKAGDTVWFSANTRGVWEIRENVRKVYVVIERPTLLQTLKIWFKSLLDPHIAAAVPMVAAPATATLIAETIADGRLP